MSTVGTSRPVTGGVEVVRWVYDWQFPGIPAAVCADHFSKAVHGTGHVDRELIWKPEENRWYRSAGPGRGLGSGRSSCGRHRP